MLDYFRDLPQGICSTAWRSRAWRFRGWAGTKNDGKHEYKVKEIHEDKCTADTKSFFESLSQAAWADHLQDSQSFLCARL